MSRKKFSFGALSKKSIIIIGGATLMLFMIISVLIIVVIIKQNKSPTSVTKIVNSNTTSITTDLMSGGWGSANWGPAKEDSGGNLSKTIYILGNNGSKITNVNTAILLIKYPVTINSVYQVTLLFDTKADNSVLFSTGNVLLLQWDGNFVLDDLTTTTKSTYITIPSNSLSKYTYNTKWWRPTGDTFTITFKFASETDTIAIGDVTITPLS
jgi:hypothetical protein